ncbi:S24 family peptidase [Myroides odoratimimus]|uniref:S24 family peptidase n=1 Tax=Myroides odoratimimus TaxID=76832 RepID=UPI002574B8CF|nr:S24 family peptidase [Myroides odoratimimus]MDM1513557.1 helix-turn-helix transcriptional regulator [Myroides odoratimimus]
MILVTTKERIIQYIDYKGISVSEFLKLTDIKRGFLDSDKLNATVSDIFIAKIIANCPDINLEWLITGNGSMLKNQIIDNSLTAEPTPSNRKTIDPLKEVQRVPLFNLTATMGLVPKSNGDWDEEFVIDYLSIPNLASVDGAVYATGDSMSPYLNSGDIIAYKKIDVDMDNIFFGEVYLLSIYMDEYSTYKTIKYLHKSDRGDDYVKLVSANPVHNDKDIPLHKIAAMGLVRASIRIHN